MAFQSDRLVPLLGGPRLSRLHQLRADPAAAEVGNDAVKPGEERIRLQFESEEEADGAVADAGDQLQDVVPPEVPAFELDDRARGAEDLVVQVDNQRQLL